MKTLLVEVNLLLVQVLQQFWLYEGFVVNHIVKVQEVLATFCFLSMIGFVTCLNSDSKYIILPAAIKYEF